MLKSEAMYKRSEESFDQSYQALWGEIIYSLREYSGNIKSEVKTDALNVGVHFKRSAYNLYLTGYALLNTARAYFAEDDSMGAFVNGAAIGQHFAAAVLDFASAITRFISMICKAIVAAFSTKEAQPKVSVIATSLFNKASDLAQAGGDKITGATLSFTSSNQQVLEATSACKFSPSPF